MKRTASLWARVRHAQTASPGQTGLLLSEWLLRAFAVLWAFAAVSMLAANLFGLGSDDIPGAPIEAFASVSERTAVESAGAPAASDDPSFATLAALEKTLGPLVNTSDGTRRASGVSSWVEVSGPTEITATFRNPTWAQKWSWVLVRAAPTAAIAAGLWLLAGLTRSARLGDPFTRANLRRLAWITGLSGAAGVVGDWGAMFVRRWLLDSSEMADLVPVEFTLNFTWVGLVVLLGVITAVWRRGVAMREDLEGLV